MVFLMASAVWTAIGVVCVVGGALGGAYILGRKDGEVEGVRKAVDAMPATPTCAPTTEPGYPVEG